MSWDLCVCSSNLQIIFEFADKEVRLKSRPPPHAAICALARVSTQFRSVVYNMFPRVTESCFFSHPLMNEILVIQTLIHFCDPNMRDHILTIKMAPLQFVFLMKHSHQCVETNLISIMMEIPTGLVKFPIFAEFLVDFHEEVTGSCYTHTPADGLTRFRPVFVPNFVRNELPALGYAINKYAEDNETILPAEERQMQIYWHYGDAYQKLIRKLGLSY